MAENAGSFVVELIPDTKKLEEAFDKAAANVDVVTNSRFEELEREVRSWNIEHDMLRQRVETLELKAKVFQWVVVTIATLITGALWIARSLT